MIAKRRFFLNQPKQKHVYLPLNVTFFRACVITYNVHLHKRAIFFRIMHVYITFHFYCYKYAKLIDRESFWTPLPPLPSLIFDALNVKIYIHDLDLFQNTYYHSWTVYFIYLVVVYIIENINNIYTIYTLT